MINPGDFSMSGCAPAPVNSISGTVFTYQTTSSSTNLPTGTPNTPATIAAGGSQSFVFALTPSAAVAATTVGLSFTCSTLGYAAAPVIAGVDTLLYSASTTPVPDVVALVATPQNDGIMHIPGTAGSSAIAVATLNVGTTGVITVSPNTGAAVLPLSLTVCQTNPTTSECLAPPAATVSASLNGSSTATFGIFATATGAIPFLPAHNRVFVQFSDSGAVVRGSTSVAVQTQ